MTSIRIFTDEDMHGALAAALCSTAVDAVSTPDVGRLGQLDETQLEWAANERRTLVSLCWRLRIDSFGLVAGP